MFKNEKRKWIYFVTDIKEEKILWINDSHMLLETCHISEIGYRKTWYLRVQKIHQCMISLQEEK